MSTLQDALPCLYPVTWDSVPQSQDELREYIQDISTKAKEIVDSIPELPVSTENHYPAPELRHSPASRMTPSAARVSDPDPEIISLQQQWGKAIKINSTKDNPFQIPVYKLAGADGKGAWFARRSVHEGLPFSVWKEKISSEMVETLKANQACVRQGKTPDKAVRGIGAEREVESIEVMDKAGKNALATMKVYHVSARFPRPTTSRDFVVMVLTWELDVAGVEVDGKRGRSWMMVSKACLHPDVPEVDGYIRGEYESVEIVREVPVKRSASSSKSDVIDGLGEPKKSDRHSEDTYPVEWIMVTRSDPGGTIPRWMVEKGTPKSICMDTVKFLNWACRDPQELNGLDTVGERDFEEEKKVRVEAEDDTSDTGSDDYDSAEEEVQHNGLIASFAYLINAGLERYAPQTVWDYIPHHSRASSHGSLTSAPPGYNERDMDKKLKNDLNDAASLTSLDKASIPSTASGATTPFVDNGQSIRSIESTHGNKKGKMTSHEKDLAKLAKKRHEVETKLETVRSEIQALQLERPDGDVKKDKGSLPGSEIPTPYDSSSSLAQPAGLSTASNHKRQKSSKSSLSVETAKMNKVASSMFQSESKLLKELSKIERDQLKITAKIEARVQKEAKREEKREEKSRTQSKTEVMRREIEDLKKELDKLRTERRQWLDVIKNLEAENSRLAEKVGGD